MSFSRRPWYSVLDSKQATPDQYSTDTQDFNACEKFVVIVTSGLVVAATQALQLKSPNEHPTNQTVPGADLMWTRPNSERQECLKGLCRQVYDTFINFKFNGAATSKAGLDNVLNYSVQLLRLEC